MAEESNTRNPSKECMLESTREDCQKLAYMREYNRGYEDGKKARDADEWGLEQERMQVADRLSGSGISEWSDDGVILRVLTRSVCGVEPSVNTMKNAGMLVKSLTRLLVGDEREMHVGERFCDRHGWCGMGSGACDGCVGKPSDATKDSVEAEVESLKRECDKKHDRIIQLQEDLLEARRQIDSLMYDGVPATEDNMEERGWVPKKRLDNANGKIRELELDIKAQRKSLCDRKKRIRGLARENERALGEVQRLKEERNALQTSIDEIDKHCMEVPTDKYGEAIMLGDMVTDGERVGYVTGYSTMERNGEVFIRVSFANTMYPKNLFHTYGSAAYTMYASGEIDASVALQLVQGRNLRQKESDAHQSRTD